MASEINNETSMAEEKEPYMAAEINEEMNGENKSKQAFGKFMDAKHVMRALRAQKMAKGGPAADETRGRGRILALLKLSDGVATRDMAQVLGVRVSSLNEALSKMERDGLIARTPSAEDKRVMLVSLTESGREKAAAQPRVHLPERMFAGFSDEELDQFSAYLDRTIANLEAELGEEGRADLEKMREARKEFGHGPHGHGHHGHGCGPHGHGRGGYGGHGHGPGAPMCKCHHHPHPHGNGHCGPRGFERMGGVFIEVR